MFVKAFESLHLESVDAIPDFKFIKVHTNEAVDLCVTLQGGVIIMILRFK